MLKIKETILKLIKVANMEIAAKWNVSVFRIFKWLNT